MSGLPMSEAELQAAIVEAAQILGWRVAHFRPARTSSGWRTPVAADGAGFPDLVMVAPERLLVVEVKGARGRLTPAQQAWIEALCAADVDVRVWRPTDWPDEILAVLRQRRGE